MIMAVLIGLLLRGGKFLTLAARRTLWQMFENSMCGPKLMLDTDKLSKLTRNNDAMIFGQDKHIQTSEEVLCFRKEYANIIRYACTGDNREVQPQPDDLQELKQLESEVDGALKNLEKAMPQNDTNLERILRELERKVQEVDANEPILLPVMLPQEVARKKSGGDNFTGLHNPTKVKLDECLSKYKIAEEVVNDEPIVLHAREQQKRDNYLKTSLSDDLYMKFGKSHKYFQRITERFSTIATHAHNSLPNLAMSPASLSFYSYRSLHTKSENSHSTSHALMTTEAIENKISAVKRMLQESGVSPKTIESKVELEDDAIRELLDRKIRMLVERKDKRKKKKINKRDIKEREKLLEINQKVFNKVEDDIKSVKIIKHDAIQRQLVNVDELLTLLDDNPKVNFLKNIKIHKNLPHYDSTTSTDFIVHMTPNFLPEESVCSLPFGNSEPITETDNEIIYDKPEQKLNFNNLQEEVTEKSLSKKVDTQSETNVKIMVRFMAYDQIPRICHINKENLENEITTKLVGLMTSFKNAKNCLETNRRWEMVNKSRLQEEIAKNSLLKKFTLPTADLIGDNGAATSNENLPETSQQFVEVKRNVDDETVAQAEMTKVEPETAIFVAPKHETEKSKAENVELEIKNSEHVIRDEVQSENLAEIKCSSTAEVNESKEVSETAEICLAASETLENKSSGDVDVKFSNTGDAMGDTNRIESIDSKENSNLLNETKQPSESAEKCSSVSGILQNKSSGDVAIKFSNTGDAMGDTNRTESKENSNLLTETTPSSEIVETCTPMSGALQSKSSVEIKSDNDGKFATPSECKQMSPVKGEKTKKLRRPSRIKPPKLMQIKIVSSKMDINHEPSNATSSPMEMKATKAKEQESEHAPNFDKMKTDSIQNSLPGTSVPTSKSRIPIRNKASVESSETANKTIQKIAMQYKNEKLGKMSLIPSLNVGLKKKMRALQRKSSGHLSKSSKTSIKATEQESTIENVATETTATAVAAAVEGTAVVKEEVKSTDSESQVLETLLKPTDSSELKISPKSDLDLRIENEMPPDFDVLPEIDAVDIPTDEERSEIPPELKHTVVHSEKNLENVQLCSEPDSEKELATQLLAKPPQKIEAKQDDTKSPEEPKKPSLTIYPLSELHRGNRAHEIYGQDAEEEEEALKRVRQPAEQDEGGDKQKEWKLDTKKEYPLEQILPKASHSTNDVELRAGASEQQNEVREPVHGHVLNNVPSNMRKTQSFVTLPKYTFWNRQPKVDANTNNVPKKEKEEEPKKIEEPEQKKYKFVTDEIEGIGGGKVKVTKLVEDV